MIRTLGYMNSASSGSRFYAVELVRFEGSGWSAFEARTVLHAEVTRRAERQRSALNEASFLESIEDDQYRDALRELFEVCRGLGLRFEWGATGTSIRVATMDRAEPVTIGWVFPGGGVGWMGLSHLTLGYDTNTGQRTPTTLPALKAYATRVASIGGAAEATPKGLNAWTFDPEAVCGRFDLIVEAITELTANVSTSV